MSLVEIKEEVASMSEVERDQLFGYMVSLRDASNADLQRRLAQKIDDNNPENWLTLDEFSRRLDSLDSKE